jgi:antitoxin component HigA of HigAB toxin-antitoxin module
MKSRSRHDVAIATALILTDPLVNLLDEVELGEFRAHCFETLMGALEAYDNATLDEEQPRPVEYRPSSN